MAIGQHVIRSLNEENIIFFFVNLKSETTEASLVS